MEHDATRVVAAMGDAIWQGALLTLVVTVLLGAIQSVSAATRYAIWYATLLTVVSLPFLRATGRARPEQDVGVPRSREAVFPVRNEAQAAPHLLSLSRGRDEGAPFEASAPTRAKTAPVPRVELTPGFWAVGLLGLTILPAAGLLGRVGLSLRHAVKLKRRATVLPWPPTPGREARIATSSDVGVPMAVGWIRPVVLLPERLAKVLDATELQQVVTHEAAHLRRWDDWTNLAQRVLEAAFFFHPAVLWIGRRLDLEREIACDDWVVAATGAAKPYALCLTRVRELLDGSGPALLAPGALTKKGFSRRIEMLLDGKRNRTPRSSRVILAGAVLVLALVAVAFLELAALVVAPTVLLAAPVQSSAQEGAKAEQERARAEMRRASEELDKQRAALEAAREAAEHEAQLIGFASGQPVLATERREPAVSESELRSIMLSVAKNDASPAVRDAALAELGGLGGDDGARALASLYDESKDDLVKESILRYLGGNGSKAAVEKLKAVAQSDPAEKRRLLAVRLLGSLARSSRAWRSDMEWGVTLPPPEPPPAPPAPPRRPPKP